VLAVAGTIAEHMEERKTVVTKSTVPVGTADKVARPHDEVLAARGRSDLAFDVVSNPEFLKEGAAVADCMRPDRIVIGTDSARRPRSCCARSTPPSTATTTRSS
jgi:UDPglucose 6-dehydrogenase